MKRTSRSLQRRAMTGSRTSTYLSKAKKTAHLQQKQQSRPSLLNNCRNSLLVAVVVTLSWRATIGGQRLSPLKLLSQPQSPARVLRGAPIIASTRQHLQQQQQQEASTRSNNDNNTDYQQHRQAILSICGELCNLTRPVGPPQFGYFGATLAPVDCPALFATDLLDAPAAKQTLTIPPIYRPDYTMNGRADVEDWYIQEVYLGQKAKRNVWTYAQIEQWKDYAIAGKFRKFGNYRVQDRKSLYEALMIKRDDDGDTSTILSNQTVLVIGSESPWVEAMCLAAGARHVSTLEYGAIVSQHPSVTTYTPSEFRQAFQRGQLPPFDAIVSYSSLEHTGLGRYGDALNPWGDIMAVARAWCVTRAGGSLILGVPSGDGRQHSSSGDTVYWNAGRIYGWHRWPYLVTNWKRANYSAGWYEHPEQWQSGRPLPARYLGPAGHEIYKNQSALVFTKVDVPAVDS